LRKFILGICLVSTALCATTDIRAQDDDKPHDVEGCVDSPLVSRYPNTFITTCDHKDFDQFDVITASNNGTDVTKTLEGDVNKWEYQVLPSVSSLQVFRNFDTALKRGGFSIVYEKSPYLITARKGNTWLVIDSESAEGNNGYYSQTIVTVKDMQQEVTADASSLADSLQSSGHVAVYGIHFDTGKAVIQPDSAPVLAEIAKLLQQNPDLKLRIEGHTDNQGAAAANQSLSEKRAQAVVAWLTAKGINASRLSAKGFGATQPVADNATDDGRAQNRRVELVKL
jgi:OmpA-OmpF porin, OOP family